MIAFGKVLAKRAILGTALEPFARTVSALARGEGRLSVEDALTLEIMGRVLNANSNAVDVGCHKGAILQHMLALAPNGSHTAFEPIPALYADLQRRFARSSKVRIFPYALGERSGTCAFHHNIDNPAYSGMFERSYPTRFDRVRRIEVESRRLDDLIEVCHDVDFIKVDVEGAELAVFRGARSLIARCKPVIVFEFGLGSSEFYGSGPAQMFAFFDGMGYSMWRLRDWLSGSAPLDREALADDYRSNRHYYFVAATHSP